MITRRFFSAAAAVNKNLILDGDELFHLRKVNRAKIGDEIEVINGKGALFSGTIKTIDKNEAVVTIEKEEFFPKPPLKTIIAPSLLKKKSMNVMIEKLTEIGVTEIRPVLFSRTDETYRQSHLKKWQRVAAQSLKVNKKLWLTDIYPPVSVADIIKFSQTINIKIMLEKKGEDLAGMNFSYPAISIIGPPGDLTPEEKELLREKGFKPYKINDCVLRSETAAIAIAAILKMEERQLKQMGKL